MLSAERRHRPTRRVIRPLGDRQTDTRINTTVLIRAHRSISDHKCHPQNPPKCHPCPDTEPSPMSRDITWDNAWAESFNATLKNERIRRIVYPTKDKAIKDITSWIELR